MSDSSPTPAVDAEEQALLAGLRAGSDAAFETLVRTTSPRLLAVARRIVGSDEDARDVLQEAYASAFKSIGRFEGNAKLSTWLHRIVVNACLDRLRRRRPTSELPEDHAAILADRRDHHSSAETGIDVRAALATLPEGQRLALTLVDMHGLSVAETAQVLGVAEGTVKSRCARGRAALAPLLRP